MSDQAEDRPEQPTAKRGEAAWKEERERVAERNDRARKLGKQQRQAYERGRDKARQAAERRQMDLLGRQRTP
jgi:hypothetical protein